MLWFKTRRMNAPSAMLRHPEVVPRREAVLALGKLDHPGVEGQVLPSLCDPDRTVRHAAAAALQARGWRPATQEQAAMLAIGRDEISKAAEVGSSALPALLRLGGAETTVRVEVIRVLCAMDSPESLAAAVEFLGTGSRVEELRLAAAKELGRVRTGSAVRVLIGLMDRTWWVREAAQESLRALGALAVPDLVDALRHERWTVRQGSAEVLGTLGDARAAGPLGAAFLRSPRVESEKFVEDGEHERGSIFRALESLGQAAVESWIEALRDGDAQAQAWAAGALGRSKDRRAAAALEAVRHSADETVRQAATEALRRLA